MNITQTRPSKKSGVQINVPKDYNVNIGRGKVVVSDRKLVTVKQFGISTIIYKNQLDEWQLKGWRTDADLIKEANLKMEEMRAVNAS